jgi:hypothetical protein
MTGLSKAIDRMSLIRVSTIRGETSGEDFVCTFSRFSCIDLPV